MGTRNWMSEEHFNLSCDMFAITAFFKEMAIDPKACESCRANGAEGLWICLTGLNAMKIAFYIIYDRFINDVKPLDIPENELTIEHAQSVLVNIQEFININAPNITNFGITLQSLRNKYTIDIRMAASDDLNYEFTQDVIMTVPIQLN